MTTPRSEGIGGAASPPASVQLDDVRGDADVNVAWSTIYDLIASLKARGQHLHVCITGGRRRLALLAMSAAMLHFDHNDRLWHMYTPVEFLKRARCRAVVEQLTPRQLDVLRAFADGQTPQDVAETLCVTVKTVHAHETVVLSERHDAWALAEDARLDYHFLREKFGRYFQVVGI